MNPAAFKLHKQPVRIPGSSLPEPIVSYLLEVHLWRLEKAYSYRHNGHQITVPEGFKFDLASVPRFFWWMIAPFELSIAAPLIHDFLYRYRGIPPSGSIEPPRAFSRKQTDRLFREIMQKEKVAGWRRFLAFWAVRWFGWFFWRP